MYLYSCVRTDEQNIAVNSVDTGTSPRGTPQESHILSTKTLIHKELDMPLYEGLEHMYWKTDAMESQKSHFLATKLLLLCGILTLTRTNNAAQTRTDTYNGAVVTYKSCSDSVSKLKDTKIDLVFYCQYMRMRLSDWHKYINRNVRKRVFWHVRPTKTQISLRIGTVWSESSLSAWRNFASLTIQNASREDFDQTAQMRSLIRIFPGRPCPKVRFQTLRFILLPGVY